MEVSIPPGHKLIVRSLRKGARNCLKRLPNGYESVFFLKTVRTNSSKDESSFLIFLKVPGEKESRGRFLQSVTIGLNETKREFQDHVT